MVSVVKSIRVGARKSMLSKTFESPTFMVVVGAAVSDAVGKSAMLEIVHELWSILFKNDDLALVNIVIEYKDDEVVGGFVILSIAKVRVVPAGTTLPKNPLKK